MTTSTLPTIAANGSAVAIGWAGRLGDGRRALIQRLLVRTPGRAPQLAGGHRRAGEVRHRGQLTTQCLLTVRGGVLVGVARVAVPDDAVFCALPVARYMPHFAACDCQELTSHRTERHPWTTAAPLPSPRPSPAGAPLSPNIGSVQIHARTVRGTYRRPTSIRESAARCQLADRTWRHKIRDFAVSCSSLPRLETASRAEPASGVRPSSCWSDTDLGRAECLGR